MNLTVQTTTSTAHVCVCVSNGAHKHTHIPSLFKMRCIYFILFLNFSISSQTAAPTASADAAAQIFAVCNKTVKPVVFINIIAS